MPSMGCLHPLTQDFIGKREAIILLKIVNHFHILQQRGTGKARRGREDVPRRIPPLPPAILVFLPVQADWNIVWSQTLVGYSGNVGRQPDNQEEHSSRINKIIKQVALGEEWQLVADGAAMSRRTEKQADDAASKVCFKRFQQWQKIRVQVFGHLMHLCCLFHIYCFYCVSH